MAIANRFNLPGMPTYKPTSPVAQDDEPSWQDKLTGYSKDPAAGKTEYQRALQVYNAKSAIGDSEGAAGAKTWMGQVDTSTGGAASRPVPQSNNAYKDALQQVRDRINKPTAAFQYDQNTDPAYQAALRTAQTNSQQAAGNISADMNKRGLLNSTITGDRGNQAAQAEYSRVSDTILPQLRNQAYQQYRDGLAQEQQQTSNLLNVAGAYNQADQQDFNNQMRTDEFGQQKKYQDATIDEQQKARRIALAQYLTNTTGKVVNPTEEASQSYAQVEGVPTLAYQQYLQGVKAQDAGFTGLYGEQPTIQKQAQDAGFTGIYNDKPTMQKEGQDFNQQLQRDQLALSRSNAARAAANSGASQNLTQTKYNDSKAAMKIQGDVLAELGQLNNEADINAWLNMNAGYIASNLGAEGYQKIKEMALSPYQGQRTTQDKQAVQQQTSRQKAISFAQSDPNWKYATPQEQQQLISFYMSQLQ